jgi:conjugative transfer signal peptidase TraF
MISGLRQPDARARVGGIPRRRIFILAIAVAAVALLFASPDASTARFIWNLSSSAPAGLYRIERGGWAVGDRVAVVPSQDLAADLDRRGVLRSGKLLIKRVVATAGDTVCRHNDEVSINGDRAARAKAEGSDGVVLPSWQGCMTLKEGQVFLLGDTAASYDGRYFGVTSADDVVGRAAILVRFWR